VFVVCFIHRENIFLYFTFTLLHKKDFRENIINSIFKYSKNGNVAEPPAWMLRAAVRRAPLRAGTFRGG
jgi:hypothetical protein